MTVRTAELLMAIATILASIGLMVKAADNNIGWVQGRGPGAGAWPFWLAAIMLAASLATLLRWFRGATPESRSRESYIDRETLPLIAITVGALIFLLGMTHVIGLYASLLLFLLFYFKFVGGHGWPATIMLVGGIPVFIFSLFEWALKIPLPKAATEELFYPVYEVMYSDQPLWAYILGIYAILAAVAYAIHRMTRPQGSSR